MSMAQLPPWLAPKIYGPVIGLKIAARRAAAREKRNENKIDIAIAKKAYYNANKDIVLAARKRYRAENADKIRVKDAARYAKNRADNIGLDRFIRRVRIWNKKYGLSEDAIGSMLVAQHNTCVGCPQPLDVSNCTPDHIIAVGKGGSDHASNLQLLCWHCQVSKWHWGMEDFIIHAYHVAKKNAGFLASRGFK